MSLGLTLIAICLLRVQQGLNDETIYQEAQAKVWEEMTKIGYSDELISILKTMIYFEEDQRPSFQELVDKIESLKTGINQYRYFH